MEIVEVNLDDLVLDPTLNLRDRLDDDTVHRYMDAWGRMPPITIFEVDGKYLVADGFHRHAAAVSLGRKSIPAEVMLGTFSEALDFVAGANLFHGLPLTRLERRRAIEVKLRIHHERSDRHLAEELSVGRELIAKIRRQLVEAGQIPMGSTRVGADGKSYPAALAKDPGEHKPRTNAESGQVDPRDRGGREADKAPWDDTTDPMPPIQSATISAPWDESTDLRTIALSPPVAVAAPTIEEMLNLMTKQVSEVLSWTQAEGFLDSYQTANANSRGLFQTSVIKLASRAEQLQKV